MFNISKNSKTNRIKFKNWKKVELKILASAFFFKLQKPYDLFLERPLTLSVAWTSVLYAAVWLSKRLLQLDKAISWWTEDYTVKIFSLLIGKRLERYHSVFQPAIHNWGFLNMLMSLSFHSWIIFLYFQKNTCWCELSLGVGRRATPVMKIHRDEGLTWAIAGN